MYLCTKISILLITKRCLFWLLVTSVSEERFAFTSLAAIWSSSIPSLRPKILCISVISQNRMKAWQVVSEQVNIIASLGHVSALGVGNINGQITMSRLVCLTMVSGPSHASFLCLSSINEPWKRNDNSVCDQKSLWFLSHLPTVGGETDMWLIFVKLLLSHHSATIRKGQILVKYSNSGNAS